MPTRYEESPARRTKKPRTELSHERNDECILFFIKGYLSTSSVIILTFEFDGQIADQVDEGITLSTTMFTLPDLPYSFTALEPYIDAQTMQLHHDMHHKAYVTKLNDALEVQFLSSVCN